jgi:hypothetical protein
MYILITCNFLNFRMKRDSVDRYHHGEHYDRYNKDKNDE